MADINSTTIEINTLGTTSVQLEDNSIIDLVTQDVLISVEQGTITPDVVIEAGIQGIQGARGIGVDSISLVNNNYLKILYTDDNFQYIKLPEPTLITTDRLLIQDNKAMLPSQALGNILFNIAHIFESYDSNVLVMEVTVTTDGTYLIFDSLDNLNEQYCVVSYITYKE